MAKLHSEGFQTGPDPIDVVEEPHVPDRENRGEQAEPFNGNISLVKVVQNDP